MENVELIFEFNGEKIKMQGNRNNNMKDIINKFLNKMNLDSRNIMFLYNGNMINIDTEKTLKEINSKENTITIIAQKYDLDDGGKIYPPKNINCPICNDNFFIEISNYKIKTKCKSCGNKENILLNKFKDSITNNDSNIHCQCQSCENSNKSKNKIFDSKLYECLDCHIHLCPICEKKHDPKHKSHYLYDFKNNYKNVKKIYVVYAMQIMIALMAQLF